jgi:transposase
MMLPPSTKVYLAVEPIDMRLSFDGLSLATRFVVGQNPLSGHLFVFFNKTKDRVKILWWDGSGYCIWAKRLEKGRFVLPDNQQGNAQVTLESAELSLILEGIDLRGARRRPRWAPMSQAA